MFNIKYKFTALVAVMVVMAAVAMGCQNEKENKDNELVENTAPTKETEVNKTEAPVAEPTVVPTEIPSVESTVEPTVEPTEEPTEVPTVEPTEKPTVAPATKNPTKAPVVTKTPTKKPVVTKTPTKKPVTTKTPTKAPTTKKPTTTKNPNADGEAYKVGNVTVTPVKGVTMWSKNAGNIRTKPWTGEGSEVVGQEYYSEIKVTGICSNGFIQYKLSEKNGDIYTGTVYINKKFLYTEKPKEFIMNGYDPVYVIKEAHKRLEAKGFNLWTADYEENVATFEANIKELEDTVKSIEDGTYEFIDNWTEEERQAFYEENKNGLEATKQALKEYIQFATVDIHKHKAIVDPDEELGSYEAVTFNINLNRMHIRPSVLTAGCKNLDDIINCIVEQYEYNREVGSARQDYVWVYYGIIEQHGETYYRFYLT